MENFSLKIPPRTFFGSGKISILNDLVKSYGDNVLIICGGNSLKKSGVLDDLRSKLSGDGIKCYTEHVCGEPTVEVVDNISNKYKNIKLDCVTAIGGGSVMDVGKAVSGMYFEEGSVKDYLDGVGTKKVSGKKLPFIAVPTTSGTGSEATNNAVIKNVKEGFKKSLRHDNFVPDVALLDPALTVNCPRQATIYSGLDAFCQLFESYVSTASNEVTSMFGLEGLKKMSRSLITAINDGENLSARSDVAYAAYLSGICILNAGLTTIHSMASTIGGLYDNAPHGAVCATLLFPATVVNLDKILDFDPNNPAAAKYAKVGALFLETDYNPDKHELYFRAVTETLKQWQEDLDIPKLRDYGVDRDDFWKILELSPQRANPVELNDSDMENILEKAY